MNALTNLRGRYVGNLEPLRSERRLELALLLLVAVIVLQLLWLAVTALREPAIEPVIPSADSLRVVARQTSPPIPAEASAALRARPLFWASRRPTDDDLQDLASSVSETQIEGEGPPAAQLQSLIITGIYGMGSEGGVIVLYKGDRRRVSIGEQLDGWELESVAPDHAVFVSAGIRDSHPLELRAVGAADSTSGSATQRQGGGGPSSPRAGAGNIAAERDRNNTESSLTLGG